MSIKLNEEIGFSLNKIFNPYDILRNIWGNVIKLYEENKIDNNITDSDMNFDDDEWVSDEDIALLEEFSKQKNNIEEPHKKLELVYPENQELEWDDDFDLLPLIISNQMPRSMISPYINNISIKIFQGC